MENKICPLFYACPDPNVPMSCMGERCAWWNTLYDLTTQTAIGGECSILSIADALDSIERQVE